MSIVSENSQRNTARYKYQELPEVSRTTYPMSKKSNMVVRGKVPWEINAQGLIAVVLDAEDNMESVEEEV